MPGGLTGKLHLLADYRRRPLVWLTGPGRRGYTPMFIPFRQALNGGRAGPGRPRSRPGRARGDTAYSSRADRAYPRKRGIKATSAQPDDQRVERRRRGRGRCQRRPMIPANSARETVPDFLAAAPTAPQLPMDCP